MSGSVDLSNFLKIITDGAGGPGAITSVFGRTGVIIPVAGDYAAAQVTSAADLSSGAAQVFTGELQTPDLVILGLTGAVTHARLVGGTASGPPTSGTFLQNDVVFDRSGAVWICATNGTPGTWIQAGTVSPQLTGTPTAPTPPPGDNSTKLATTAFVMNQIGAGGGTGTGGGGGGGLTFNSVPFTANSPYNQKLTQLYPAGIPIDANNSTHIAQILASMSTPPAYWKSDVSQFTVPVYDATSAPTGSITIGATGNPPGIGSGIHCEANYPPGTTTYPDTGVNVVVSGHPRPVGVKPSQGSDSEIEMWHTDTGDIWNLWGCTVDGSGFWNGGVANFSHFVGALLGNGVPAATPKAYASRGPGIPYGAGLNRKWEADVGGTNLGSFNHAQAFAYSASQVGTAFIYPGVKSDGSADSTHLPECARLKLRDNFPVQDLADPLARAVATQWQQYGIILADNSGTAKVYFEADESVGLGAFWGGRMPVDLMNEVSIQDFLVVDPTGTSSLRETSVTLMGGTNDDPLATLPAQTGTVTVNSASSASVVTPTWTPAANESAAVMISMKTNNATYITSVTGADGLTYKKIGRRIERSAFSQNLVHELWAAPGGAGGTTGAITVNVSAAAPITVRAVKFTAGSTVRKLFSKDFACVPTSGVIAVTNNPSTPIRSTTALSLIVSFGTSRTANWAAGTGQTAIALNDKGGAVVTQSSFTQPGGGDIVCTPGTLSGTDEWLYTAFEVT